MAVAQWAAAHKTAPKAPTLRIRFWLGRLVLAATLLILGGLLTVYSTTVFQNIAQGTSPYGNFLKHVVILAGAIVVACIEIGLVNIYLPARRWLRWAIPVFFFASLVLVLLVHVPGLGVKAWESSRFLKLGPLSFQPSELLKLILPLYLTQLLCWWRRQPAIAAQVQPAELLARQQAGGWGILRHRRREARPLWPELPKRCMIYVALAVGFTVIQPDLGSAGVIFLCGLTTIVLAGVSWRHMLAFLAVLLLLIALAGVVGRVMKPDKYDYVAGRITTWLNPAVADPQAEGFQITQARGALALGGVFGRGYLRSEQKMNRLPLSTKDFVFPVIVEEFGFVGALLLLALFLNLAWAGLQLSQCCRDPFNKTVIAALGYSICIQAFVNIGVNIGTFPLSGITLPFYSEGGTSLVLSTLSIGMMAALGITELREARRAEAPPRAAG